MRPGDRGRSLTPQEAARILLHAGARSEAEHHVRLFFEDRPIIERRLLENIIEPEHYTPEVEEARRAWNAYWHEQIERVIDSSASAGAPRR